MQPSMGVRMNEERKALLPMMSATARRNHQTDPNKFSRTWWDLGPIFILSLAGCNCFTPWPVSHL